MPILKAYEDGYKKFIIISNKHPRYKINLRQNSILWGSLIERQDVNRYLRVLPKHYQRSKEFINNPPEGVKTFYIRPNKKLPVGLLTRNKRKINKSIKLGESYGEKSWEDLKKFLDN